jgi:hypothetical protein
MAAAKRELASMGRTQANSTTSTRPTTGAIITPECHVLTVHTPQIVGNFPPLADRLLSFEAMEGPYPHSEEHGNGWTPEPLRVPVPGPRNGSHQENAEPSGDEESDDRVGTYVTVIDIA